MARLSPLLHVDLPAHSGALHHLQVLAWLWLHTRYCTCKKLLPLAVLPVSVVLPKDPGTALPFGMRARNRHEKPCCVAGSGNPRSAVLPDI